MNLFRCGIKSETNVYIGDTAPIGLIKGILWLDTTDSRNVLKVYNGTEWLIVRGTWAQTRGVNMYVRVAISDTEPTNKTYGMLWLDISDNANILKVYNGTEWLVVHF